MTKHGTASRQVVPGWYVEFQQAVLRALPRDIDQKTADRWRRNGKYLAEVLRGVLIASIGDLKLIFNHPFDPVDSFGKGWSTWRGSLDGDGLSGDEDVDPRSLALTEVKLSDFLFENFIQEGEKFVSSGREKLRRTKERQDFIQFSGNVFLVLRNDYRVNKENSILEWLYRNFDVTFMDFMGQILRDPGGFPSVPCLCRRDPGEWYDYCRWLNIPWGTCDFSVGCAS